MDPITGFLSIFEPSIAIAIFAVIVMVIINIPYKFLVNQGEVLEMKKRIKELNKKTREAQKKGDTDEVKKMMSETMSLNSKMMKFTMKPMLVSFVVVIVMLPWLAAAYGDVPVPSNGMVSIDNSTINVTQYAIPTYAVKIGGGVWNVISENNNIRLQRVIVKLPADVSLPLIGNDLGWLGWYFIVSIPSMIIIRKLMGIHL